MDTLRIVTTGFGRPDQRDEKLERVILNQRKSVMDTLRITGKQQWACDKGTVSYEKHESDNWYWYVVRRNNNFDRWLCETLDAAMQFLGCDKVEITPEQAREYRLLGARE